jgi:O-antigen ligase
VALLVSILGIAQYFLQAEVGLRLLGESSFSGFSFPNPSGKRWLLDSFFPLSSQLPVLLRSCATFYHPNAFGGFLFFSLLSTFYLFFLEKRRLFLHVALFIQCFALFTTYSRSGILALIVATLLFLGLQCKTSLKKVVHLSLCLFCIAAVCLGLFYAQLFARGGVVNYNTQAQAADQERIVYQKMAVEMEKESPWLGVGFNNFQFHAAKYAPSTILHPLLYKVHNIFLLLLAETGLLGLGCFLLFIGACLFRLLKSPKTLEFNLLLALLLGSLLIGGCDMYLLENSKLRIVFFALFGLICLLPYPQRET